jgi:undecaprenyl-diphosphatase
MLEILKNIDVTLLKLIHDNFQNPILDKIMPVITYLGNGGIVWIIISLVLIMTKKYRKIGILCALALLLNTIIGEGILKNLFQRQRPFVDMPIVNLLVSKPVSYSFPSGHTSTAFAVAGVLGSQFKRCKTPIFILASLIAFSRLYLFVHYPFDVLAGIIQGMICAKVVLKFYSSSKNNKVTISEVENG